MKTPEVAVAPIGWVDSPYKEKFAVPRQPGLAPSVISKLMIPPPFGVPEAFSGLEEFSHIWIIFRFHENLQQGWKAQVRPPRLGGNKKTGVFATRSSFRPNGFGMSVVPLLAIQCNKDGIILEVSGLDLVHQTPIYDIKPYVPYVDAVPQAIGGFATAAPDTKSVEFEQTAASQLHKLSATAHEIQNQVKEVLAQDPRPAYRKDANTDPHSYGTAFHDYNFRWRVEDDKIMVFAVEPR